MINIALAASMYCKYLLRSRNTIISICQNKTFLIIKLQTLADANVLPKHHFKNPCSTGCCNYSPQNLMNNASYFLFNF